MTERISKFVLCLVLIPLLLALGALLMVLVFALPFVALLRPDLIKVGKDS